MNALEQSFEDGKSDRESLYSAVRNLKISKAQVSEFLRHTKCKTKEIQWIIKFGETKIKQATSSCNNEWRWFWKRGWTQTTQEKKRSKKEKVYEYNKVTGVYHSPNLGEHEKQMITDLSGLANS